jgi:hypothetical protein
MDSRNHTLHENYSQGSRASRTVHARSLGTDDLRDLQVENPVREGQTRQRRAALERACYWR